MNSRIPEPLQALVNQLTHLPGLGPKSAMRVAMALLKWPEAETRRLGKAIYALRDTLHLCSRCGALTEVDPCPICTASNRDDSLLCVVTEWDSMITLEEGGFFTGRYLILGELHLPLDTSDKGRLTLNRLMERLAEGKVHEVILALGATVEADSTGAFIRKLIKERFPDIQVSRLAQGIPLGAEVKFMDRETLRQSLLYRQELQ